VLRCDSQKKARRPFGSGQKLSTFGYSNEKNVNVRKNVRKRGPIAPVVKHIRRFFKGRSALHLPFCSTLSARHR
jgi:hypothetical protein